MTKNTDDPNQERNGNERGAEINLRAYLRRKALCLYTTNSFDYFLFLFLCYYRIYVATYTTRKLDISTGREPMVSTGSLPGTVRSVLNALI